MAEVIRMPKMSDTMEEGVIASWLKKVGDEIKAGDVLAEVETDKATMELEAYQGGTLLYLGVKDGGTVPVDGVIAIIGEKGENIDHLLQEVGKNAGKEAPAAPPAEPATKPAPAPAPQEGSGHASAITMPRMSDTMTEGTIAAWHKKVGDKVKPGDLLAEVETDKATMELEAYEEGTLLYLGVEAGASVAVDGVIAVIGEEGADYSALISGPAQPAPATDKPSEAKAAENVVAEKSTETVGSSRSNGRLRVSPLARKLAREMGYDLNQLKGSGEGGRIIKRDIENFVPSAEEPSAKQTAAAPAVTAAGSAERFEEVPVSQMRKTIAKRLAESKFTAPHFYLTMAIDMQKAVEARTSINEVASSKISFNDLVVKAASLALRRHPKVNAAWLGDRIRYNHHVHIGVAVAVDEGLLVPVIRFADQKSLSQIGAEVKDLAEKAKSKKLQPADWEGNTFTISNLGMFGIEEFTAIINPPDACILAVGAIRQVAVVRDGMLQPGHEMKVTLSCDHRVVDGATGAAFLQTFRELLENPVRMLA